MRMINFIQVSDSKVRVSPPLHELKFKALECIFLDLLFLDYRKEYEIFKNNRYSHSIPFLESEKEKALLKCSSPS